MACKDRKKLNLKASRTAGRVLQMFLTSFVLFVFLISCKTTGTRISDFTLEESLYAPLDSGGTVYIFADARRSRSIIDLLPLEELQDNQVKKMLNRTDYIAAALFPQESGRRFQLAARGNYPSFRAGLAFSFNKDWEKQKSANGETYWYSRKSGLSVSMNSSQAFALSAIDNIPVVPVASAPGVEFPEGFGEFSFGAPLSCWLNNPASMINRMLNNAGVPLQIPVQEIYINILSLESENPDEQYKASIRLLFENETQARGMASLLMFSSILASGSDTASVLLSLLAANPPQQNGRCLDVKTDFLSENDMTLLFQLFSL